MLETEPQNRQPDPNEPEGSRQGSGQEGGQRRGLLRRTRRGVSKPAEVPEFRSGAADAPPAEAKSAGPGAPSGGSGRGGSRVTAPVPAVPVMPAPAPAERGDRAPAAHQPVPAAAFQAPVVVFQPPDLSERRATEPDHAVADDGSGDDSESPGAASRRRRRGGRGRGKGAAGDGAAGQGAGAGQAGSGQAGSGQAGAAPGGPAGGDQRRGQGERTEASRPDQGRSGSGGPSGAESGNGAASAQGNSAPGNSAQGNADDDEGSGAASSRRRRRRRQRGGSGSAEAEASAPDDPTDTVVHVREPRPAVETDDVRAVKGSTRLEAKRQRRRESRDTGRRRPPIISESEFLARREAVERVMLVRQQGDRTQIAVLEDGILVEHYVDKASHQSYVGNVYLGKVQNVLPSMEAAFVDIGKGRNAVLYAGEVNFDATGLEGVAKRIESALKSGQSIMVQVTKDPIGHKGARLTSQVSLPGRYLVYVPGASMTGISRKLPDTERTRLKQILKKVAPEDGGIIVRTAAEGATEEELLHDVTRLVAQWQAIERKAKTATAPDLLYGEPDLTIRVVRDIFNEDFTKLVIASDSEWDLVDEYVRYVAPNLSDRLERWGDEDDLFGAYRIDEQLTKALDRKVWLPSGGSLVIDTTEAMTVIDVNTGKFTGQGGNLEQTVTRNNLEAAEEIVRQLRLRDIGGIIVIDFIDMVLESNRDLVLRRLIECLARDRTKHQVAEVTSLGLVQMTRKRVGSGLLAAFSVPCEHCNGRGVLISTDLTEAPHSHGRLGQPALPKPGPVRSRSARSKAIAQVAAATDGPATDATLSPADPDADFAARTGANGSQEDAQAPDRQAPARAGSARSGSGRSRRSEPVSSAAAPDVTAVSAVEVAAVVAAEVVPEAGPESGNGSPDQAESPRRRARRSAYREAGPPDSVASPGAAPEASPVPEATTPAEASTMAEPTPIPDRI
jgi:ribonuclease E